MGRPALTTEDWIAQAKRAHGDKYDYTHAVYTKYAALVRVVCHTHGVFEQRENNHRNGAGCPRCGAESRQTKRSHSYDSFVSSARKVHGDTYTYPVQEIYSSRTKARIVCAEHGEFSQLVYTHIAGQGCPACARVHMGKRSQLGISEFLDRAKRVHGDTYEYVSGLSGLHKDMRIRCRLHGEFKQTPHNHLAGAGCPRCVGRVSKGEQELLDFVASLGFGVGKDSSVIAPFEIDVYVPSKRVGIEYHGLWFHREALVGNKTREKWERSDAAGVKLIQIFEDEWKQNRTQVENRIRAILGVGGSTYARKCEVLRIDAKEAREFLNAHHTQGAGTTTKLAYGLKLNGQLIAVAAFGAGRFKNLGWELLRYASVGRVLGGISRLVSAFRRDHQSERIVSYADLRWGDGESYRAAGFTLESITEPDYWWADASRGIRHTRYALQPHKTGMAEKDYAEAHKLVKILGVGHKKWVLDTTKPT